MSMNVFGARSARADINPLRWRKQQTGMLRGQVLTISPTTVRLFGDTDGSRMLVADSYTPVVGDPVAVSRLGPSLIVVCKIGDGS